ncbi:MAG: type 1 glutamine amidotransferase [Actinomycetota bacterium]
MKPVIVLQNEPEAPAGYLGDALDRGAVPWFVVRMYAGESPPEVDVISGAVSLGGAMGAYEEEKYPFLVDQKRFLAECTAVGVPVLGICLGCQLLADALGGRAYLADEREVLLAPVEATSEGAGDPVIAALAGRPVIRFHKDTFDVPPGTEVLATGGGFPQAFRFGSALGIQPHPEVTPALLSGWLAHGSGREAAIAAGTDPDALVAELTAAEEEVATTAAAVFDAWLDELTP